MKKKILPFIIGVLVGVIIATAGFLIYEKTNNNETSNFERPREMMNHRDGETPPDRPDGEEMKFDRQKNNQNTTESTT